MTKRVYKAKNAAELHARKASPPPKADSKRVGSGKHAHPQQRGSQENKRKH